MSDTTENQAVNAIIDTINNLSPAQRKILAQSVRSTTKGINAFKAFNYGVGAPAPIQTQAE